MDEIFGLPTHILVVHAVVVLVPLAGIGVLLSAFWPAARHRLALATVAIALVGTVSAFVAAESGSALEDEVDETELVEDHAQQGDSGLAASAAVLLGALGVAGFGLYEQRRASTASAASTTDDGAAPDRTIGRVRIGVGVVAVVLALLGTAQITIIGHSGAKASWSNVSSSETNDDD